MRFVKALPSSDAHAVHPVIVSAATIAHGFMRSMAIKQYVPKDRRRKFGLLGRCASLLAIRCQLFREKGAGAWSICRFARSLE